MTGLGIAVENHQLINWRVSKLGVCCLAGLLWLCSAALARAASITEQREAFLHAEHLLAGTDQAAFLEALAAVNEYPLYPYLKSRWLNEHLDQTEQVKQFLERYGNSRYGNQVRLHWLNYLATQSQWQSVLDFYHDTDGIESQCVFQQAKYLNGQQATAMAAAKHLWLLGEDLPSQCDFLINTFKATPEFSTDLIWQRFDQALQRNKVNLAQYLKGILPVADQATAVYWLQLRTKPDLVQTPKFAEQPSERQGSLFAYAVERIGHKDPLAAVALWEGRPASLSVEVERQQKLEHTLALAMANNKLPGAFERLMRVTPADDEIKEWRLRAALNERSWSKVGQAFAALTPDEQGKSRWQYWQARSLLQLGQNAQAEAIFRALATKAEYFGFLAADYVDLPYAYVDTPVPVVSSLQTELLESDDFKLVQELRYHQRDHEAEKQWWYIIKRLDKEQLKAAAKIAHAWQWRQMAIFTLAKADYWDDMTIRFPVHYLDEVNENANLQSMDTALIFGLIRQESAFYQVAASPVGARGLMQIMPATGAQIARELQEPWASALGLFDPALNIRYGTYYYKKLLQRFNGHFALATAGYNAGPHRVAAWLPTTEAVPADVWVETIPFKETRKYVSAVLSYALIYQQRLHQNNFKMRDLMRDITPF